jgi:Ca2+-transporting ATPase
MGITGTDVAKGARRYGLTDDNFATIQKAIEEGRNIYGNIKKTRNLLLSSNLGEILTMFVAITAGLAAPLRAIHILWINLITDSLPALSLGVDSGDPDAMRNAPRNPRESLLHTADLRPHLFRMCHRSYNAYGFSDHAGKSSSGSGIAGKSGQSAAGPEE